MTVVTCTGTGEATEGNSDTSAGIITQYYSLTIKPPSGVTHSSMQSTPSNDVSTGLTGDPGVYDCSGCLNTTSAESAKAEPGSPQIEKSTVTIEFTFAQWRYLIDDQCSNDSSEYETVEPDQQASTVQDATATYSN